MVQDRTKEGKKMIMHIKTAPLRLMSSLILALSSAHLYATTWKLDDVVARHVEQTTPYFFYVGKGESWQDVQFSSQFDVQGSSTVIVRYDNQLIHQQNLSGKGTLNFSLPPADSGFHRLDISILQKPGPGQSTANICLESSNLQTTLTQPNLSYQSQRNSMQLNQLPDVLFNSQLNRPEPVQALLGFNTANFLEATMISRLATAWNFATPVQWRLNTTPESAPDFMINIQRSAAKLPAAQMSLNQVNLVPSLTIEYSSEPQLLMAVNALLNQQYLAQLNTATASLNGPVARPNWASVRRFESLADLGISDFKLDNTPKNISLVFPAVWEATDILKGQLNFRSQSGLLQGSTLQVWLNEVLAGSTSLAKLDSSPVERQFEFVGADYPYTNSFNMTVNNNQLNSNNCLPNAGNALWIDAKKSKLSLPYQMKQGVISLSTVFDKTSEIAMNTPIATPIAISLAQVAKNMLLSNDPIGLNITQLNPSTPKTINILLNAQRYQSELQKYSQILYLPTTANGSLITVRNGNFWIYSDNNLGVENFARFWPQIQQKIPNNTAALFISAQGQLTVLSQTAIEKAETPIVEQISMRTIAIILVIVAALIIGLLFWRRTRKAQKTKEE